MVTIPSVLLLVIALVLFLLAAWSFKIGSSNIATGWLGLAFLTAAQLWPHFVKVGGS